MRHRILYTLALLFAIMQAFAQTYTYDNLNRLTKVVYGNGVTVTYSYDVLGNRLSKSVTGATGKTYTITVSATPTGSGSVSGGGKYKSGAVVELNAIPNTGFEFSKWSDGNTSNPRSVTVTKNQSFTAQFVESAVVADLFGDIVVDGKVNNLDLNALVNAYLSEDKVTKTTDLDADGSLSIADIAKMVPLLPKVENEDQNNGHDYVDLDLPSGIMWATCNLGANSPEEYGDYFAWGETESKSTYNWSSYKWCNGMSVNSSNKTLTKYCLEDGYGAIDNISVLKAEDDAASVLWGGSWRMPTDAEMQELIDNCTKTLVTAEGSSRIVGYKFTGTNGNSIILPAAGDGDYSGGYGNYWSSSLRTNGHSTNANGLEFSNSALEITGNLRYHGLSIRPVFKKEDTSKTIYNNHEYIDMGLPSGLLWATCNVGANSPEETGCYYAWGETEGSCEGKNDFSDKTYKHNYNDGSTAWLMGENLTKYVSDSEYGYNGYTDDLTTLEAIDDAATSNWGGEWRMPTRREVVELFNKNYTSWEFTELNGVKGFVVTSLVEGYTDRSIFLPAFGGMYWDKDIDAPDEYASYWTSSLYLGITDMAYAFELDAVSGKKSNGRNRERKFGLIIRPVVSKSAINQ